MWGCLRVGLGGMTGSQPRSASQSQLAGVVSAVGQELARRRHNPEQRRSSDEVMGVPGRQNQGSGPAQVVGQGVNLRRPTAPGGSDGVVEGPPFAPAAERWAFT